MSPRQVTSKLQYGTIGESDDLPDALREHLPEVQFPFPGAYEGRLVQGPDCQLIYSHFKADFPIEPHQHKQHLGIVLCGEAAVTMGKETKTFGPGEWYLVPADTAHEARMTPGTKSIDIWFEPSRFKPVDR